MKKLLIAYAALILFATDAVAQTSGQVGWETTNPDGKLAPYNQLFRDAIIFSYYPNNMHAAEDGNYLAQTKEELQTYVDLDMDYEFITSSMVRNQLGLTTGEGLFIVTAPESGEGHSVGFRDGDLVLKVNDESVDTQYDFVIAVTENRGSETNALIRRNGASQKLVFSMSPVQVKEDPNWIIGVAANDLSDLLRSHLKTTGVSVTSVSENSPAQKMGILVNDIICQIGESEISNMDELREAVQESNGESVTITLLRAGNRVTVELTPQKRSETTAGDMRATALWNSTIPGAQDGMWMSTMAYQGLVADQAVQLHDSNEILNQLSAQIESLKVQIEALKEAQNK